MLSCKRFGLFVAMAAVPTFLWAQGPLPAPSDVVARSVQWKLTNPPTPPVAGSAAYAGVTGNNTNFYWVVARFLVGNAQPAGPYICGNTAPQLSSSNYCTVSWMPVPGATGYDVLLTSTGQAPNGTGSYAVATNVSGATYTDQSGSTSSYTVATVDPDSANITAVNVQYGTNQGDIQFLNAQNQVIWDMRTGGGSSYAEANAASYPNLQSALSASTAVYIPSNTTVIANGVTIRNGQTLRCFDPYTSIIQVPDTATGFVGAGGTGSATLYTLFYNCGWSLGNGSTAIDGEGLDHPVAMFNVVQSANSGNTNQTFFKGHGGYLVSSYYSALLFNKISGLNGTPVNLSDAANQSILLGNTFNGTTGTDVTVDGGTCAGGSCPNGSAGTGSTINTVWSLLNDYEGTTGTGISCGNGGVLGATTFDFTSFFDRYESNSVNGWNLGPQCIGARIGFNWYTGTTNTDNGLHTTQLEPRSFGGGLSSAFAEKKTQSVIYTPQSSGTLSITLNAGIAAAGGTYSPTATYNNPYATFLIPSTPNGHAYQLTTASLNGVCGTEPTWPTDGSSVTTVDGCVLADAGTQLQGESFFFGDNSTGTDIVALTKPANGNWGVFDCNASVGCASADAFGIFQYNPGTNGVAYLTSKGTGALYLQQHGSGGVYWEDGSGNRKGWFTGTGNIQFGCSGDLTNCGVFTASNTATRTYGLPDASGTLALGSQVPSPAGSQYAAQYNAGSGSLGGVTPPTSNGTYYLGYNVTGGAAVAPTASLIGFKGRNFTLSSDTIAYSDNGLPVNYVGSTAVSVTLPTATTLGNAAFGTVLMNNTTGSSTAVTVTPTTWTINGSSSLTIAQGQSCKVYTDASGTNWDAECHDLPFTAGSNITITRGQYGPTIAATGASGVSSFSGSGIFTNSGSTGAVTLSVSGNSGGVPYFNTASALASSNALTSNALMKGGGAGNPPSSSSVTDNGTNVTTTDTGGYVGLVFVANGTTAGFVDYPQGSTSSGVAPCNTANSICEQAPTAVTYYLVNKPGAAASGVEVNVNASNTVTQSFSGDTNHALSKTSQTAAISTATLCAATAGTACGQVGQYRITYNLWGSGTACSSVTAGSVQLQLTWTDEAGTAHSAIALPVFDQKTAAMATQMNFNTALGTEGASGQYIISTNGTVIQYATSYTACSTGTGTYNLRIAVEQIQ